MSTKAPKPIATPVLDAVFNDESTRELAKTQEAFESNPGNSHYEMTEDPDVLAVGEAIKNSKHLNEPSEVRGVVDVSSATAGQTPEAVAKMFADFRKELQTDIKNLIDERLDRDIRVNESYPKPTRSELWQEAEKRRHAETKKWMTKFRNSPVASKLAEALIVGDTFKTPWARKIAVKLFEADRAVFKFLNDIANAEFVVTRHNIVSKMARKVLGTRLPDEPEFVDTDSGSTTTRWADIANKAAKISHIKDADPHRVERVKDHKPNYDWQTWENHISNEIKKSGGTN